ncbi:MAG: oligosaccharide flippase family protein [Bacteroidales bacterium]|nr:oligosaccharide flippase family protein [Bacteroidales bacterium]MCF8406080.1 oligosaccharide flippase family protein [Bacteroidales bacterium]
MSTLISRFRASEFLRNVFTLVSATSVGQAIALLIYPVLSRIYTPAEHGLFALYMSIISITAIMSTGKYELAVMLPEKEKDGASLAVLSVLISFTFSIFLFILIILFGEKTSLLLGNPDLEKWLWFVPLSTFLIGIFQSLNYWSNRVKRYKWIAGANLSQSLTNSAVKISTNTVLPGGGGLIVGAITGQVIGVIAYTYKLLKSDLEYFRELNLSNLKKLGKSYVLFPKYNMVHYLTNNFSSSLPIFVLSSFFSSEKVGFYSLGFMMINRPMNLLSGSFTQVFSQRTIEMFNKGQQIAKDVKKFILRLVLIAILPFTLAAIFGPGIFDIVFGKNWHEAGVYMRILLPWLFVVFISSPLSFLPDMLLRQKKAMLIDLIKFFLRIIVLAIGVKMNDIYLSLYLFSGISFILVSYNLYWYVFLSDYADKITEIKSRA